MKKGLLILCMSFFCTMALAQGTVAKEADKQEPAEQQQNPKAEPKKEVVKTVPPAKEAAKPERVIPNGKQAKPAVARPARNPRPAARPVRPGRGR